MDSESAVWTIDYPPTFISSRNGGNKLSFMWEAASSSNPKYVLKFYIDNTYIGYVTVNK